MLELQAITDLFCHQEIVDYLQYYIIERKIELMETHFDLIYRISFQSNILSNLQNFCINYIVEYPEKLLESIDFSLLSEEHMITIIKRDDLRLDEIKIWEYVLKWGLA